MKKKILAYLRVNQEEEKSGKPLAELQEFLDANGIEVDELFIEQISNNYPFKSRVKLVYALNLLNAHDTLILLRLMDLGYQAGDVMEVLFMIKEKNVRLCVVDTDLFDSWVMIQNNAIYQAAISLLLKLLNKVAFLEKKQKSLDTLIGMSRAEQEGRKAGHPKCVVSESFVTQYKNYKGGVYGGMCLRDFCKLAGVSRTCYYKYEKIIKSEGRLEEIL